MGRKLFIILGFFAGLATTANCQSEPSVPDSFGEFETGTGECSVTYKKDLQLKYLENSFKIPKSYTIKKTPVFQRSGISPPTGTELQPLQHVLCLASERDKVLITSVDANDRTCGWVTKSDLASVSQPDATIAPCGKIEALKVKDFCSIAKSMTGLSTTTERLIQGCNLNGVKDTQIDTKFITDNTTSRRVNSTSNSALTMKKIPIFATENSDEPFRSVDVFSVSKVFDAKPTNQGSLRVLIGDDDGPSGWTDLDNGHIWYSTLTTYFNANGTKSVYLQKIVSNASGTTNPLLAAKPPSQNFMVEEDFVKFPVLFDMREREAITPKYQAPQLEVAFIGKFCDGESGEMCSGDENKYSQAIGDLRAADVVFLIDGSKSMSEYFGLVAESLTNFTEEYIGNPDYRFGVAMYGDFKAPTKTSLGDPIDYQVILDLQPNYLGNFSSVENADLLIFDALKDKSEAAHAAVYETANTFQWTAENKPHFLIHIADHGDRQRPSQKVFNALAKSNIFYIPIAVEGEAILKESQTFINDARIFAQKYTTPNGNRMAVEAIKSYGNGNSNARESIAKALVKATGGWPDLGEAASEGDIMAIIADAAKEIFNIPASDDVQVLAATGYIETAAIGSVESNWDYFISLDRARLSELYSEMEKVCTRIGSGDSTKLIQTQVFNMVGLLTNDEKSVDEMIKIWREGAIPLQTETIIGSGIKNLLLAASTDQDLTPYRKEFCRTSLLLELMLQNFKLRIAEEGAGMIWEDVFYEAREPFKFNWVYTDLAGKQGYYLPLSYLPRPVN